MTIDPNRLLQILETHYSDQRHQLIRLIHRYSILYDLPKLQKQFELPDDKFATMPENVGFVIVAVYDLDGRILVKQASQHDLYSLVGPHLLGGTVEKLSSFCLEEAASEIVQHETSFEVLELEPIAIVQNTF